MSLVSLKSNHYNYCVIFYCNIYIWCHCILSFSFGSEYFAYSNKFSSTDPLFSCPHHHKKKNQRRKIHTELWPKIKQNPHCLTIFLCIVILKLEVAWNCIRYINHRIWITKHAIHMISMFNKLTKIMRIRIIWNPMKVQCLKFINW